MSNSDNRRVIARELTPTGRVKLQRIDALREQHKKLTDAVSRAQREGDQIPDELVNQAHIERLRLEYHVNKELQSLYTEPPRVYRSLHFLRG